MDKVELNKQAVKQAEAIRNSAQGFAAQYYMIEIHDAVRWTRTLAGEANKLVELTEQIKKLGDAAAAAARDKGDSA